MYNLDSKGRPAPGAPLPKWGDPDHKEVCTLCFQMKGAFDGLFDDIKVHPTYWKALHDKWASDRKQADKLRPGDDYLAR